MIGWSGNDFYEKMKNRYNIFIINTKSLIIKIIYRVNHGSKLIFVIKNIIVKN